MDQGLVLKNFLSIIYGEKKSYCNEGLSWSCLANQGLLNDFLTQIINDFEKVCKAIEPLHLGTNLKATEKLGNLIGRLEMGPAPVEPRKWPNPVRKELLQS